MRIGIDIDDTITETNYLVNKLLIENNIGNMDEDFDSYLKKQSCDFENLIKTHIDSVLTNCPIKDNVKEVIDYLREKGNKIYIITARSNHYSSNVYQITVDYLKKHGIEYDELLFGYEIKKNICIEKQIDIMLDDNKHTIKSLKDTKIDAIIFDTIYNKDYCGKRVNNWLEFKEYIDNLEV